MTGPYDSVIGQNKDHIVQRFLTGLPVRFSVARDDVRLHGIVIDVDETTGKARGVKRVEKLFNAQEGALSAQEKERRI